jgi:hypothetical protein
MPRGRHARPSALPALVVLGVPMGVTAGVLCALGAAVTRIIQIIS